MHAQGIATAARLLAVAHRSGSRLDALPAHAQPTTFAEAAAIQAALLRLLGETPVAYKVAGVTPETAMWGAIPASRAQASPAAIPAALVPMLGVEPEVAFRLDADIAGDTTALSLAEFDGLVTILPVIEIVDSRFTSYAGTPLLHRAADLMSNGALVHGASWPGIDPATLASLAVEVRAGGRLLASVTGGHPAGDPRLPALAFLRAPGRPRRLPRGTIVTTGSYAGLLHAAPGDTVTATFPAHGSVTVSFTA